MSKYYYPQDQKSFESEDSFFNTKPKTTLEILPKLETVNNEKKCIAKKLSPNHANNTNNRIIKNSIENIDNINPQKKNLITINSKLNELSDSIGIQFETDTKSKDYTQINNNLPVKNLDKNQVESGLNIYKFFIEKNQDGNIILNNPNSKVNYTDLYKAFKTSKCILCSSSSESIKMCPCCLKPICEKCLQNLFRKRDLDNNEESNYSEDIRSERPCPYCQALISLEEYISLKDLGTNATALQLFDSSNEQESNKEIEQITPLLKNLDKQYTNCDMLIKKIDNKKKEIDFQKKYCLNVIDVLRKKIEEEYDNDFNILNEINSQLKSHQNDILANQSKILMEQQLNNNFTPSQIEELNLNNLIIDDFYKNVQNFEEQKAKLIKNKGYKIYESKTIVVDLSDCYNGEYIPILSNNNLGDVYIQIIRDSQNNITNPKIKFIIIISQDKFLTDKLGENNNNYAHYLAHTLLYTYLILSKKEQIRFLKFGKQINNAQEHRIIFEYSLNEEEMNFCDEPNFNLSQSNQNNFCNYKMKLVITEINL